MKRNPGTDKTIALRVLIADNDEHIRVDLKKAFDNPPVEGFRFDVTCVESAHAAEKAFRTSPEGFDVVILDQWMETEESGSAALFALNEAAGEVISLVYTGQDKYGGKEEILASRRKMRNALHEGAVDVLDKGFVPFVEVVGIVIKEFRRRQAEEQNRRAFTEWARSMDPEAAKERCAGKWIAFREGEEIRCQKWLVDLFEAFKNDPDGVARPVIGYVNGAGAIYMGRPDVLDPLPENLEA